MQFLTIAEVCKRVGCERWTLYRYIKRSGFPKPVRRDPLDSRVAQWEAVAVEAWCARMGLRTDA